MEDSVAFAANFTERTAIIVECLKRILSPYKYNLAMLASLTQRFRTESQSTPDQAKNTIQAITDYNDFLEAVIQTYSPHLLGPQSPIKKGQNKRLLRMPSMGTGLSIQDNLPIDETKAQNLTNIDLIQMMDDSRKLSHLAVEACEALAQMLKPPVTASNAERGIVTVIANSNDEIIGELITYKANFHPEMTAIECNILRLYPFFFSRMKQYNLGQGCVVTLVLNLTCFFIQFVKAIEAVFGNRRDLFTLFKRYAESQQEQEARDEDEIAEKMRTNLLRAACDYTASQQQSTASSGDDQTRMIHELMTAASSITQAISTHLSKYGYQSHDNVRRLLAKKISNQLIEERWLFRLKIREYNPTPEDISAHGENWRFTYDEASKKALETKLCQATDDQIMQWFCGHDVPDCRQRRAPHLFANLISGFLKSVREDNAPTDLFSEEEKKQMRFIEIVWYLFASISTLLGYLDTIERHGHTELAELITDFSNHQANIESAKHDIEAYREYVLDVENSHLIERLFGEPVRQLSSAINEFGEYLDEASEAAESILLTLDRTPNFPSEQMGFHLGSGSPFVNQVRNRSSSSPGPPPNLGGGSPPNPRPVSATPNPARKPGNN